MFQCVGKQISVCISIHAAQHVWLDICSVLQSMIKCNLNLWLYARLNPAASNQKNARKQLQVDMHTKAHTQHRWTSQELHPFKNGQTADERLTGQKH